MMSGVLGLAILGLYALVAAVTADDLSLLNDTSPLEINTNDLLLRVGTSDKVYLSSTDAFSLALEDAVNATLQFYAQSEGIIGNVSEIPLKLDGIQVFQNTSIIINAISPGRVVLISELESSPPLNLTVTNIFLRVIAFNSSILLVIADIVGWIYFLTWSISFYPQIYQNWQKKSVRGLSLDFVCLNVTGFLVYGMYNLSLLWVPEIQREYFSRYPTDVIPVQIQDVIFSLHAIFASGITLVQCIIYEKGAQTVSNLGRFLLMFIYTFLFVILVVALSNHAISWLVFLTVCSYVKLFITLIKYVPQAYLNWSRKSTSGWSIGNVLLDLTGGIFSLMQMIIIGYNFYDWWSLLTDFTKFGLGFFSICFDILFITQHYCLYRNHEAYDPVEGTNFLADPYEDMITSNNLEDDELERLSHKSKSSSTGLVSPLSS